MSTGELADPTRLTRPHLFCDERVALALECGMDAFSLGCPRCLALVATACAQLERAPATRCAARVAPVGSAELAAFCRALRPGPVGWAVRVWARVATAFALWRAVAAPVPST